MSVVRESLLSTTTPSRTDRDRSRQTNRTFLVREPSKSNRSLQRRSRTNTGGEKAEKVSLDNSQSVKRLTLQRRTRTDSVGRSTPDHRGRTGTGSRPTSTNLGETTSTTISRTPSFFSLVGDGGGGGTTTTKTTTTPRVTDHTPVFKTPVARARFDTVSRKRDFFEELARAADESKPACSSQVNTGGGHGGQQGHMMDSMENTAVTVAVRVRPFSTRELKTSQVVFISDQETILQNPATKQKFSFNFDLAFSSIDDSDPAFASQQTVYEKVARPLLLKALQGFNVCIFAYGQTGSGKSYTMMGSEENPGIVLRFCQELFAKLTAMEHEGVKSMLEMSFCEVYNEKIHDLLVIQHEPNSRNTPKTALRVREHPSHGTYVADLSTNVVTSESDIQGWLALGNKRRATASTGMNDKSSRSHSILTLVLRQTKTELVAGQQHCHCVTSRINLVDLAGSERSYWPANSDRFREGKNINKSLLTLGKVISALSEQTLNKETAFVPYRDSVLTWLLKDSLGGNSQTAMIATVSPAASCMSESLSTLRYAQKTSTIVNVANINEDESSKLIRVLKEESEKLMATLTTAERNDADRVVSLQQEVSVLRQKLLERDREIHDANRALEEKRHEAEARKRRETVELQKVGVTFQVDNHLPSLVNLNEDPQLSEKLIYIIKQGQTSVGRVNSGQDIQLNGGLIADRHCVLWNVEDTVSIVPAENAKTFVNGIAIAESTVLHHGDRIILGGTQYFRLNHPCEAKLQAEASGAKDLKDFDFAKNELLASQNSKLLDEIQQATIKTTEELLKEIEVAQDLAQKEQALQQTLMTREQRKPDESLSTTKRKRLFQESRAAEEAVCRSKIICALEEERKRVNKELQKIFEQREKKESRNVSPKWDSLKLSLMIEEANEICKRLNNCMVLSRYELTEGENSSRGAQTMVRVQNNNLGITTLWTVDKFQEKIVTLRELEQENFISKDDDVFYDPDDEWEHDFSSPSATLSLSHRRKRKLSQRLYEKQVQRLDEASSQSAGGPTATGAPCGAVAKRLPEICNELISRSLSRLEDGSRAAESTADKIAADLNLIDATVKTIIELYNDLDGDNTDSVFVARHEAQTALIKGAAAVESAGFISMQWSAGVEASHDHTCIAESLKCQVKRMGEYLQMLIKGCESDITMIVKEVERQISPCLHDALVAVGHLAAVTGTPLHNMEPGTRALAKGILKGVHSLFRETFAASLDVWGDVSETKPTDAVQHRLKVEAVDAGFVLQKYINEIILKIESIPQDVRYAVEEEATPSLIQGLRTLSSSAFKLKHAVKTLHEALTGALRGGNFGSGSKAISTSSGDILKLLSDLSVVKVSAFPTTLPDIQQLRQTMQKLSS
ncbi:unnamed protein product [Ophioblennius macclurei]